MVTNRQKKSCEVWLKRSRKLFESRTRWRFESIITKRGTYFAVSFLVSKSSCKILAIDLIDIPAVSANSRTFTFGSSNTMSSIFSMISGVVTSFGLLDHSALFVLIQPRLNSQINHLPRWRRFPITSINSLCCLHGVSFYQETVFNQHTKSIFFHFNKKTQTCLLLSFVTLKVNNRIGLNFNCCRLKDCTSRKNMKKLFVVQSLCHPTDLLNSLVL